MLAGLLAVVVLIVRLFPETPFGRALNFYLVELPLRLAHRIERRHLILLVILLCSGQMLAMMGSVELALAYAADLSIYYDAAITASLTAAAVWVKRVWSACTVMFSRLVRPVSRPRATRTKAQRAARQVPSNDDDPAWVFSRAA